MNICFGSLVGRDHWISGGLPLGKNCQDAFGYTETDTGALAIVADGCGSGEHSEFGAKLAVSTLVEAVNQGWRKPKHLQARLMNRITAVFESGFYPSAKNVNDYFLFTIVGIIVDKVRDRVSVFAAGDGVWQANEVGGSLDYGNFPKYLGYNLLEPGKSELEVLIEGSQQELLPAIVGTDGLAAYPDWRSDYREWIAKNANVTRLFRKHHSVLHDDTTCVGLGF